MNSKDTIQSIQKDLKNMLLRAKKETATKNEALKKVKKLIDPQKKNIENYIMSMRLLKSSSKNMKNILNHSKSKKVEKKGKILNAKKKKLPNINVRNRKTLT